MTDGNILPFAPVCPAPKLDGGKVQLAHGGGGRAMGRLVEQLFLHAFDNEQLLRRHDGASLRMGEARLAFTTDSYVVSPLFFPGGDIGTLAVNGTVNDLAMCGARPQWLSASFILEEGLRIETLQAVVRSMQAAAAAAGVKIVTGDTKVVDRGKADGLFINTAGIGPVEAPSDLEPRRVQPGDVVILSGDVGRHGIAVMASREGLGFETTIESDCAALVAPVLGLIEAGIEVHCLRDPTRGGLASALVEIAEAAGVELAVEEQAISVAPEVRGACELLGLDPIYVANEGRFVAFVPAHAAEQAVAILRDHPVSAGAAVIGDVRPAGRGFVRLRSPIGGSRVVDLLSGEQLPRIC
jgi:hydrogenase expression/formation protein HypE